MSIITRSFETIGGGISHVCTSCATAVQETCTNIGVAYEAGRQKVVQLARDKLTEDQAVLVDKISKAIPEVFVALAALFGNLLAIPGLIVAYARKIVPLLPIIRTVLKGEMTPEALGNAMGATLANFDQMFEELLVPALFVAFTVDMVYSFAVGWITHDLGKMLWGSAISFPATFLALRHMLQKHPSSDHPEDSFNPPPSPEECHALERSQASTSCCGDAQVEVPSSEGVEGMPQGPSTEAEKRDA